MKTAHGKLTGAAVMEKIAEYRQIGKAAFFARYGIKKNSRTHWLSFEGELFPAKAIFATAHKPPIDTPKFNTSEVYGFASELNIELVVVKDGRAETARSAIDDLDELSGTTVPTQQAYYGNRYVRDPKVRAKVIKRAEGRCEHCGELGFSKLDGGFYLETHHIIHLAKQGPDSVNNVIALCSNDHRRAHFGADAAQLEEAFTSKLAALAKSLQA